MFLIALNQSCGAGAIAFKRRRRCAGTPLLMLISAEEIMFLRRILIGTSATTGSVAGYLVYSCLRGVQSWVFSLSFFELIFLSVLLSFHFVFTVCGILME